MSALKPGEYELSLPEVAELWQTLITTNPWGDSEHSQFRELLLELRRLDHRHWTLAVETIRALHLNAYLDAVEAGVIHPPQPVIRLPEPDEVEPFGTTGEYQVGDGYTSKPRPQP